MDKKVYINGPIADGSLKSIIQQVKSLDLFDGERITFVIDSPGGYVDEGQQIAEYMQSLKQNYEVHTHGVSFVASIASYVYLAADYRTLDEDAQVMIHNPWTANAEGDASELERYAKELRALEKELAKYYVSRTKLSEKEATQLMSAETYFNASEAVDFGFAHKIVSEPANKTQRVAALALIKSSMNFKKLFDKLKPVNEVQDQVEESAQAVAITFDVDGQEFFIEYEGEDLANSIGANAFLSGDVAPDGVYMTEAGDFEVAGGVVTAFTPVAENIEDGSAEETENAVNMDDDKEEEKNEVVSLEDFNQLSSLVETMQAQLAELAERLEASENKAEDLNKQLAQVRTGRRRSTKFIPAKPTAQAEKIETGKPLNTPYSSEKFGAILNLKNK
jgi:ATP-dependent Clp protease protease subunit